MKNSEKERKIYKSTRSLWRRVKKTVRLYTPDTHCDGILLSINSEGATLETTFSPHHFIGKDLILGWSAETR